MIKVMKQKNVGAGQTELVLAHIFWIFCKFMLDPEVGQGSLKNKFEQFLIEAAKNGLKILEQNQSRVVNDEDEIREKYILSASIVTYLKLISE